MVSANIIFVLLIFFFFFAYEDQKVLPPPFPTGKKEEGKRVAMGTFVRVMLIYVCVWEDVGAFVAVPLYRVNEYPMGPHPAGSYESEFVPSS